MSAITPIADLPIATPDRWQAAKDANRAEQATKVMREPIGDRTEALSAFGAPRLPKYFAMRDIHPGRAVVTFFGEPIGRVRLKRSGAPAGRVQPEPGRVTPAPGTWTFTLIGGKRETGFRTRSAALRAAVFAYQQIHGEFIEVDVIETTIQAIAAVEAQQVALADARHVRDAVIAEAIAAGVGVRSLARATGMTAARVSQIVAAG